MRKGFTLIELLVVLAVASIAVTIAVPSLSNFINTNRQAGAVNDFLSSMYLARDEALTRNLPVTICPSSDGATCEAIGWEEGRLVFVDEDADQVVDGVDVVLETGTPMPTGMTVSSPEFATALIYRPNGRVTDPALANNSGTFNFCSAGMNTSARVAQVDFTGRPRSQMLKGDQAAALCSP